MATRQYIGARYVPKFYTNSVDGSTQWEANVVYDPLIYVTLQNGHMYISKKQVPATVGTPASNVDYWLDVGNYNGFIEELQEQIDDNKDEFDAFVTDTNNKFNTIVNLNVRNYNNRRVVFIGDSYTQVPSPTTSFVGKVVNDLGLASSQYHNIGVNGAGLGGYAAQVANYAFGDASVISDVVVVGGLNDAHTSVNISSIETKIQTLYSAIVDKFPNATIWAGFCGAGYYTNFTSIYSGFTYNNIALLKFAWKEGWARFGKCIYMDDLELWERSLSDTDYFLSGGSGIHPNGQGIIDLGNMVANYMKGGANIIDDANVGNYGVTPMLSTSAWVGPSTISKNKKGRISIISINNIGANLSTTATLSASTQLNVLQMPKGTTDTGLFILSKSARVGGFVWYKVSGSSNYQMMPCDYIFDGNQLKIDAFFAITPVQNVDSIWIPHLEFVVPSDSVQ